MRCRFATWVPSPNFYPGGMAAEPAGVVLHIEQGSQSSAINWFLNPASQVSAHFAVAQNGSIVQFVDTADAAWAEAAGNGQWISIEHEGFTGNPLTLAQLTADARIVAWLKGHEGGPGYAFPLVVTDSPSGAGVGWHGMGGVAWGDHPDCPGEPAKAQRPLIIAGACELLAPTPQGDDMAHIYVCPGDPSPTTGQVPVLVDGNLIVAIDAATATACANAGIGTVLVSQGVMAEIMAREAKTND